MSFNVDEVCDCIVKTGLYADMLANLGWNTLTAESLNDPKSGTKRDFVEAHIATLHNVVRKTDCARAAFRQHHAVDVVQKFRACSEFPVISLRIYYAAVLQAASRVLPVRLSVRLSVPYGS